MHKGYDPRRYSFANYDQHLCLKPPLLLWVSVLYLSRAVSLPLVIGISSLSGGTGDATALVRGLFGTGTLLPSCIAFPVLCALMVRSPSGGRLVRWIFARGRVLLVVSAILDAGLALTGLSLERAQSGDEQAAGVLLGAVFDAYFLVYLLFSRRVRDVFTDFPLAEN